MQTSSDRPPIKELSQLVIDQIKAGEVIERPSDLIKEILENALDAGATQISLHIKNNGLDLIELIDNGHGIPSENLPLAFKRHYTSKLNSFQDLYNLHTFGFRGEALASIVSVANVHCFSTPRQENQSTGEIYFENGVIKKHLVHTRRQAGTHFIITKLFASTPVRLKFLKAERTEKRYIQEVFSAFVLAHPNVQFSLRIDEGEKIIFSNQSPLEARLQKIFRLKEQGQLTLLEKSYPPYKIRLYYAHHSTTGGKKQFLFANQRLFDSKKIHYLIKKGLEEASETMQAGHYALFIETSPEKMDVNVHPHKTHIKFLEEATLHALIHEGLKQNRLEKSPSHHQEPLSQFKEAATFPTPFQEFKQSFPYQQLKTHHEIFKLKSNSYLIRSEDESCYWQNPQQCLKHYFEKYVENYKPTESELTPLLVGQPLTLSLPVIPKRLEQLVSWGFDLTSVSSEQFILRAHPSTLDHFPVEKIVCAYLQKTGPSWTIDIDLTSLELSQIYSRLLDPDDIHGWQSLSAATFDKMDKLCQPGQSLS